MSTIPIGRLLRANTAGCVIGCQVSAQQAPVFGEMVRIPLEDGVQVFGLVYEIHVDDDGLVRQLVSAPNVSPEVIADNRANRNVPLEMSVAFIGWQRDGVIHQSRPPRPPLTLDEIYTCESAEVSAFCAGGRFAYLRGLLRNEELPIADLLSAHLAAVLSAGGVTIEPALREVIALLKEDYPTLMDVLSAVSAMLDGQEVAQ